MPTGVFKPASANDNRYCYPTGDGYASDAIYIEHPGVPRNVILLNNVNIDQGSIISSAVLTLKSIFTTTGIATVTNVSANDVDSASVPSTGTEIRALVSTTAVVPWSLTEWTVDAEYTVDITTVIQEVTDRPGWVSGNDILIIIDSVGECSYDTYRAGVSYGGFSWSAGEEPKVDITWLASEGDAAFDTPFPTFAGRPGAVSSFNSLFPTATSGNRSGAVLNATMPMFYTNKYEEVTGKLEVNMPFFSVSTTGLYQPSGNLEVDMPMFTVASSGTLLEPGYASFETPTFTLSAQSGWHGSNEFEVPFVTFAGSTGVGISFEVPFVKFNAEISEENTADLSVIMSMFDVSGIGLNGRIATASFNMMFPSLSTTGWFMAAGVLEAEMPFMLLNVVGHSSRFSGYEMRYVR